MHSAIYHGWLRHRRTAPRKHAFRYPLFMIYLGRAEGDRVFRRLWIWSARRTALARVPRSGWQLAATLLRFPLMSAQVMAAIHWQALILRLNRVPVLTHPDKLKALGAVKVQL